MPDSSVTQFDLVVVGGGINGAGIARDAAGRGLKVALCEKDDLANHTSQASSKLIHGGLRYLEQYEFGLVAKALAEREVLLRSAPHIIWPMRFVMPHVAALRPAWMIRIGLFLYDNLAFGKRKLLPASRGVRFDKHESGAALKKEFKRGFEYSDAWVEDSRLVVLNALDAAERGAEVMPRTRCIATRREATQWHLTLEGVAGKREITTRALVNATGPWVSEFTANTARINGGLSIRQVKGSHIVVPAMFDHADAYIFQNTDKRVVFALPYEGKYTLIGTTDVEHDGDPAAACIEQSEIDYLCTAVNRYFKKALSPTDVVHTYCGVRPLVDDGEGDASAVTRDFVLEVDTTAAPLLSVFGGKITTYRKLAENAMERLSEVFAGLSDDWTASAALPGGDIENADFAAFLADCKKARPWLAATLIERLARAYGTRIDAVLNHAQSLDDLGAELGDGLYECEVTYLRDHEWASCAEDVLWRRSKLGLHVSEATKKRLSACFSDRVTALESA